jgi:hypothetical protein
VRFPQFVLRDGLLIHYREHIFFYGSSTSVNEMMQAFALHHFRMLLILFFSMPVVSTQQYAGADACVQPFATVERGVNFLLIGDSVSVMKKNFR